MGLAAARWGGLVAAANSWVMPGNEMPVRPTLVTHGCAATASTTS